MYKYLKFFFLFIIFKFDFVIGQDTITPKFMVIKYPNGNICSKGYLVNNKPDGFWKNYYISGIVKSEGLRVNHLLDSIWVFFSEAGDTTEKIYYLSGKKNGYYFKYKRSSVINTISVNTIISKELYINDFKEGISNYYFDNGSLYKTINYRKNKKEGISKEYDNTGKLIAIYRFLNDYLIEKNLVNQLCNNKPEGQWLEYYPNGTLKAEKYFKDGQLSGYYKEFDSSGRLLQNQLYIDGKIKNIENSDTIIIDERLTYYEYKNIHTRFYYKNNIPVGIHREYDLQGKVINSWVYNNDGKLISTGIINDDGSKEGNFTYFYSDGGIKSSGMYRNNLQDGKWLFFFKNRNYEQIGFFDKGYLDGKWIWFSSDSILLKTEHFIHSSREGVYLEFNRSGDTIVKGFYKNNSKEGRWFFTSGDSYSYGIYKNDLKEGTWQTFYSNGKLMYRGTFVNGLPEGRHYFYYEDGTIKEEQFYVMGLKENNWKKYNPDGSLFLLITYQNDTETKINGYKLEIVK